MSQLSRDLKYFIEHQDDLVRSYGGRVLLIKDGAVVGDFDSALDAYSHATDVYETGTFSIQECAPGESAYTVRMTPLTLLK